MASSRNTRTTGSLRSNTSGAVYVEFLVAFIPFFVMVLGMIQEALMYSAHLVVQHAAASAARSAMVVFPDCEYRYGGARMNDANGGGRWTSGSTALGTLFGASLGGVGLPGFGAARGGARLDAVRFAASFPLVAASPSLDELMHDRDPRRQSLIDAIGGTNNPAVRLALGAFAYNSAALSVTLPQAPRDSTFRDRFGGRDPLTVRVSYLYHCGVPIVSRMACDDMVQMLTGVPARQMRDLSRALSSGRISEIQTNLSTVNVAARRLSDARPGQREFDHAGLTAATTLLMGFTGGNFSMIRAEVTLPNQGTDGAIARPCYRR